MDESRFQREIDADSPPLHELTCPGCGQAVDPATAAVGPIIVCPHCGTQFFPPAPPESRETDQEKPESETQEPGELEALRIRQAVALRRAAFRTRSYFIVGATACAIIGIQTLLNFVHDVRERGWHLRTVSWLIIVPWCLLGVWKFGKAALHIHREIHAEMQVREQAEREAGEREHDFTPLSDGSQQARNLERMVEEAATRNET